MVLEGLNFFVFVFFPQFEPCVAGRLRGYDFPEYGKWHVEILKDFAVCVLDFEGRFLVAYAVNQVALQNSTSHDCTLKLRYRHEASKRFLQLLHSRGCLPPRNCSIGRFVILVLQGFVLPMTTA